VPKVTRHSSHEQRRKTGIVRTFVCLFLLTATCFLDARVTFAAEEAQHGASSGEHGGGHAESPLAAVWKWGNFLILFGGLGWYLRQPLREFLETRSRSIEEGLASGRLARESALKQMSEIENRLVRLDDEVRALRAQAVKEAEEERARILESAKIEAQKILEMAHREIEGLKKSARLELKAHVADLAVKLAEERLQKSVGSEENKRLVLRFLDSLETAKN
jgi:F-type H+-transporting ATPase subunit b